jgi:sporulation protein YlmC with PRC-barrel domain
MGAKIFNVIYVSLTIFGLAIGSAAAQPHDTTDRDRSSSTAPEPRPVIDPMPLTDWTYERIYEGWYADAVVDRAIYGPHGDEIGNVKNLLLNMRGEIVALVAEVGGFWDIADTHVTIPWREIERRGGRVYSPITAQTAENYGMFADEFYTSRDVGTFDGVDESFRTGPHVWKVTALLDDYVVLPGGEPFGYVTDLVFDDAGKLISVVAIHATRVVGRRGVYAFPWDDRGWAPGLDHYTLRHPEHQIERLPKVNYAEFDLTF